MGDILIRQFKCISLAKNIVFEFNLRLSFFPQGKIGSKSALV